MSSPLQSAPETSDPEMQFKTGIKFIITAYETKTTLLLSELSQIHKALKDKTTKLSKIETLCSSLIEEKAEYESKLISLSTVNSTLKEQLSLLQEQLNSKQKEINNNLYDKILYAHTPSSHILSKSKSKTNILHRNEIDEYFNVKSASISKEKTYNSNNISNTFNSNLSRYNSFTKTTNLLINNCCNGKYNNDRKDYLINKIHNVTSPNNNTINSKKSDLITKNPMTLNNRKVSLIKYTSNTFLHLQTKNKSKSLNGSLDNELHYRKTNENNKCNIENKNEEININNYTNINNNTHSKNSNDFLKSWKHTLSPEEYKKIINIMHSFNSHQIEKDEMRQKISSVLNDGNHLTLLKEFDLLCN